MDVKILPFFKDLPLTTLKTAAYNKRREAPEVRAKVLFLPTFHEMEFASGAGCHAPVLGTPGDGKRGRQNTSLLNIAGEKTDTAALWGLTRLSYPMDDEGLFCKGLGE